MADSPGRRRWLAVGSLCGSRSWEPHLISSSTQVFVYKTDGREVRRCLECHRLKSRLAARNRKAAEEAGFGSPAEWRRHVAALEEERRKDEKRAEAMALWAARVAASKGLSG